MNATRTFAWCVLVALAACGEDHEPRVRELEKAVQDHTVRQAQLEARVTASLDALAGRVDAMVESLAAAAGVTLPPAPAKPVSDHVASPSLPAEASTALTSDEIAAVVADRHRGWMAFVLAIAGVSAAGIGWRWRRSRRRAGAESTGDHWSAATVLADGVQNAREPAPNPAAARLPDFVLDDEVFVLDPGEDLAAAVGEPADAEDSASNAPAEPARPRQPVAPPPAVEPAREPPRWSFQLEASDPVLARAAIAAYLRHDPRVLQRPAPVLRDHPSGLAVECALLPGLVAGEREHLRATLQRLVAVR